MLNYNNYNTISQWAGSLGLPATLSTIQGSANYFNSTLPKTASTDWMKNIGKTNNLLNIQQPTLGAINPNLASPIKAIQGISDLGQIRNFKDLTSLAKGGINSLIGNKVGDSLFKSISGTGGLNAANIGLGVADMGLQALGVRKQDAETKTGFDKAIGLTKYIPGVGGVIGGAVDLVNQYAGKTSNKQGTDSDMNVTGYSIEHNTEGKFGADKKHGLSDRIKGWFGKKTNVQKANEKTKAVDNMNLLKSAASFDGYNMLAAQNTQNSINQRNYMQKLGGYGTGLVSAKMGTKLPSAQIRRIAKRVSNKPKNVIPDGAFHSRKHNLPEGVAEHITPKGIPVISKQGGEITQHAEVERNEIIFHKQATETLENYLDKYEKAENQKEKDAIAIKCGKFIAKEILVNTDDRTGLIDTI